MAGDAPSRVLTIATVLAMNKEQALAAVVELNLPPTETLRESQEALLNVVTTRDLDMKKQAWEKQVQAKKRSHKDMEDEQIDADGEEWDTVSRGRKSKPLSKQV